MMTSLEKALIRKLEELTYENEQLCKQNSQLAKVVEYAQGLCEQIILSQTNGKETPGQNVYFNDINITGILADITKTLRGGNNG